MALIATNPTQRKVILDVDGSQAEARVVAQLCKALCGKSRLDEIFNSGRKIHKVVASIIFRVPEQDIPKDNNPGSMYYTAKRGVHAYDNGMAENKFAVIIRKPVAEARRLLDIIAKEFPEVKDVFHPWVREQLQKTRTLTNPYGRPHYFMDRMDDELYRRGYTYFQQSGVGDHTKKAFTDFYYDADPAWEAELLTTTHDSVTAQVLADPEIIWKSWLLLKALMERPMPVMQLQLVVPAEGGIGRSWRRTHGFKSIDDIARLLKKMRFHDAAQIPGLHQGVHAIHIGAGIPGCVPLLDRPQPNGRSDQTQHLDEPGIL